MKHLKVGDQAPDFTVNNEKGEAISMADFKGQKLAIYFYPKDMTPGCTNQACNLTENYAALQEEGIAIIGVSADDEARHQKFIDKYNIPFTLLADVDKKMINDYGVWGLKKFMGKEYDGIHRTTFLINEEGVITHIIEKPKTKAHAEEILEAFNEKN
ncbi:peroxiredoxin Q/BCP [Lishizhenia tianjinensis]|uniref:thioredoxin-dependent peroxiredoxin n=1 Tax=Lishizhenia tianjinensis TaxID=477690 RepID=A0A1I7BFF9_9FLAO|nr:thioredoxin-dependent thiol peroxidase [Lishizhenia tianjinensis]SFT85904.1 peroxiredoxin Q/BCP [Lishizhenia tianjinensis]